jgi:LEA14-like dessication related protein
MKKILLFIGGVSILGFGVYKYFKTQADLLSKFTYKIIGIKIKKFSLSELAMDLTIRFSSEADFEATIKRIYLDMFLGEKNVGYISQTKPFIIPARGTSDISLSISISPQLVLKNITDIVLGITQTKDAKFSVKGFANIKSGFISITLPLTYETGLKEYLKKVPVIA